MTRVVLLASENVINGSEPTYDGFTFRYRHAFQALNERFEVEPVSLDRYSARDAIQRALDLRPSVAIAPALMGWTWLAPLTARYPTIALVEEAVPSRQERRRLSSYRRSRLLVREERDRWSCTPPSSVVLVNDAERAWATTRFPRSHVQTIPVTVDISYWSTPIEDRTIEQSLAFFAGTLAFEGNARGVAEVARELSARIGSNPPPLVVASASKPHSLVMNEIGAGSIRFLGTVSDVRPHYRSASVCVIPSFDVPGTKSTVLQAWAAGVPVVASREVARSVACEPGDGIEAGSDASEIADLVLAVAGDSDRRARLVRRGREQLDRFDHSIVAALWSHVVTETGQRSTISWCPPGDYLEIIRRSR